MSQIQGSQIENIRSRDDDDWLKQFIDSKPTCFLILGKNSSGRTTLATKISQQWNCEHVSFDKIFREGLCCHYPPILSIALNMLAAT